MSNDRGAMSLVVAFAVGGIVGAGLAMFLSPSSGREMRELFLDELDDFGDKVKDGYDYAKDNVEDGVGKVKEFVGDKTDIIKDAVDAGKNVLKREKADFEEEEITA